MTGAADTTRAFVLALGSTTCVNCDGEKVRWWLPHCAGCFNALPLSCRQDIMRFEQTLEAFERAQDYLKANPVATSEPRPTLLSRLISFATRFARKPSVA